jgi:hypothetical protein
MWFAIWFVGDEVPGAVNIAVKGFVSAGKVCGANVCELCWFHIHDDIGNTGVNLGRFLCLMADQVAAVACCGRLGGRWI